MFHSLAVDPVDDAIVYVGTETNGIFKTTDRGLTWVRLRNGLKCTTTHQFYPEVYDIAVDPTNHNTVYAATVTGPDGGPLVGVAASFSLSIPGVPLVTGTVTTDATGIASFRVTVPAGAGVGTAAATVFVSAEGIGEASGRTAITIQ